MECAFCTDPSIQARTIFENELVRAFLTTMPITPGHALVVPKRHVALFSELTLEERAAIFDGVETIKKAQRSAFNVQGFNLAWNEGKVAGQSVPHFHLHIVPRKKGDNGIIEYEPRKFLYRPGSRAESPDQEISEIVANLRDSISNN